MSVLLPPVTRELGAWPETNRLETDIGVYIFDKVCVDRITDLYRLVSVMKPGMTYSCFIPAGRSRNPVFGVVIMFSVVYLFTSTMGSAQGQSCGCLMRGRKWASVLRVPVAGAGFDNHTSPAYHRGSYAIQDESKSILTSELQICPFLSLPGELCNPIHDFFAGDGAVNLPASQSRFGNLRYVCQLFYSELSPMYLARAAIVLQPVDVERYLAVFYPGLRSHENDTPDAPTGPSRASTPSGLVKIDLPLGATIDLGSFDKLRPNKLHFSLVRGDCTNGPLQQASDLSRTIVDSSCSNSFQQVIDIDKILFR
jgi:hypothetical protein